MSHAGNAAEETGKLDLVPMIDCVMLLLLFFILTSTFRSEEQHLSALLSTEGGQGDGKAIEPPKMVRIVILPGEGRSARVRIGGGEELVLDGAALAEPGGPELDAALSVFHAAIAARLAVYEQPGPRTAQPPVEIHCATRLPWRHAVTVYDAVRGYEADRLERKDIAIVDQRQVAFGAPTVRRTDHDNESDELDRLEHLR